MMTAQSVVFPYRYLYLYIQFTPVLILVFEVSVKSGIGADIVDYVIRN